MTCKKCHLENHKTRQHELYEKFEREGIFGYGGCNSFEQYLEDRKTVRRVLLGFILGIPFCFYLVRDYSNEQELIKDRQEQERIEKIIIKSAPKIDSLENVYKMKIDSLDSLKQEYQNKLENKLN